MATNSDLKHPYVPETWAENFSIVDIEINAWSSLFANLKTNLVFRLISRGLRCSLTFEKPVFNFLNAVKAGWWTADFRYISSKKTLKNGWICKL